MIPPQVNGATNTLIENCGAFFVVFPMIPPQVNGATGKASAVSLAVLQSLFPMIPPQVNGATTVYTIHAYPYLQRFQ